MPSQHVYALLPLSLFLIHTSAQAEQSATQQAMQLETLVYTAQGFEQNIKKAAATISIVTQEELQRKNYPNVFEALKDVPGVTTLPGAGGAGTSEVSLRGMGGAYTLFLVNGKKISNRSIRPYVDTAAVETSWLPNIESIERIEVIRGPMSGLYGSDAMGGVINIITKKNTEQWTGSVKLDTTLQENSKSGDILQSQLYLSGPLIPKILSMRANTQFYQRAEDKIASGFAKEDLRSGAVAFSLTALPNQNFDFEVQRTNQARDFNVGKTVVGKKPKQIKINRTEYSLSHQGDFGLINTTSYIQREENQDQYRQATTSNTTFNSINKLDLNQHSITFGGMYLKENLEDKIGNQFSINNQAPITNIQRYNWALFLEDNWEIVESFSLATSLRLNNDQKYGKNWNPKLYGVWSANENWTVKGGVTTGYKAPNLRSSLAEWGQYAGKNLGINAVTLGNPDLKPETSVNYEAAVLWDNRSNITAGMTVFNNKFKNKISEITRCDIRVDQKCTAFDQDFDLIRSRQNIDKATMQGVELDAQWDIQDNLDLKANYTFTKSTQDSGPFKGQPLNEMPKHLLNIAMGYSPIEQWDYWGRMNYRGKSSDYIRRNEMVGGKAGYLIADLGLNYKYNASFKINATINNLFDKSVNLSNNSYVLDGRRYSIGGSYRF